MLASATKTKFENITNLTTDNIPPRLANAVLSVVESVGNERRSRTINSKNLNNMIRNKIEIEVILNDKGNIKIASGGAIYSVERLSPLAAGLEVDLLYSLGIMDKMEIKKGDRVNSGGILGTVVEANQFNEFVTVLMDDDKKELSISRKYIETVELEK